MVKNEAKNAQTDVFPIVKTSDTRVGSPELSQGQASTMREMSPASISDIVGNLRTAAQKKEAKKRQTMSIELNAVIVYDGLRQSPTAPERVLMLLPQAKQREFLLQTGRIKEGQLVPVPLCDRIGERQQEIREDCGPTIQRMTLQERNVFERKIAQDTAMEFVEAEKKEEVRRLAHLQKKKGVHIE